jgi:hypothetical protein
MGNANGLDANAAKPEEIEGTRIGVQKAGS